MEQSSQAAMVKGSEGSKYLTVLVTNVYMILFCSQLNGPISITLCKKSNALYIADKDNNRVQLWYLHDNEGVTIAGSPTGVAGTTAFTLNIVNHIALNANETRLFISDRNNSRIQRFQLI